MKKKIIALTLLLGSMSYGSKAYTQPNHFVAPTTKECFESSFLSFEFTTIEECTEKLNDLSKNYYIMSYEIVAVHKKVFRDYQCTLNMVVEIKEKKGDSECGNVGNAVKKS